jgi:eukaryotic-like serine/threonine-protein kinase
VSHTCPSLERLQAFQQGRLPEQEVDAVAEHLEGCPSCEELAQRLDSATDDLLIALRNPGAASSSFTTANWQGTPPAADLLAQENWPSLPGYEILGLLGRGGMGVVYKARHLQLNRMVALKQLQQATVPALARARLEAEALARLGHPNIVQIHEIIEQAGSIYLALELVQGGSLEALLTGKPQPLAETARFVATLARAVHHAHLHGIVHRDLKPANILVDMPEGRAQGLGAPKITDFGVAKRLAMDSGQTREGDIIGTPSYMAPEQASGKGQDVGPATDVYALGVILYEMLTGRVPLQGPTAVDTLLLVRSEEPVSPRRLQPRIARDLETICLKCLRKDPARRYVRAEQLADDLQRYLDGRPILARPTPAWEHAWKWARRHPAWAVLAALLAAGMPVVTALWFRAEYAQAEATSKASEATLANEEAQQKKQEANQARDTADRLRQESEHREAILALERGSAFCSWGAMPRGLLWLTYSLELAIRTGDRDLERAARINLADWRRQFIQPGRVLRPGDRIHAIAVSPDGKRALIGAGLLAQEWDLASGEKIGGPLATLNLAFLEDNLREVRSLAYSPDGGFALVGRSTGGILLWNLKKKEPVVRISHGNQDVWTAAYSPDGGTFLSTGADEKGPCVRLWDGKTGRYLDKAFRHDQPIMDAAFSPDGEFLASASRDGTVRLWRISTGQQDGQPLIHPDGASSVAFSPDGKLLCTVSRDGGAHLWDRATHQSLSSPLFGLSGVAGARFSLDGEYLLTGSWDGQGRLWHVRTRQPVGGPLLHGDHFGSMAFSADKETFLTGSHDQTVRTWRLPRLTAAASLQHARAVFGVVFSPDDRLLLTGCKNQAQIWDLPGGKPRGCLAPEEAFELTALAQAPDGKTVAVATWQPKVSFWDVSNPDRPHLLDRPKTMPLETVDKGNPLIFLPRDKKLLTFGRGARNPLELWDLSDRPKLERVFAHDSPPRCLAVGPTGELMAVGCRGRTVSVWNINNGLLLHNLVQPGQVLAVALGKDDQLLVGCRDGAAYVWNANTGQRLAVLQQQSDVLAVAFSPDGRTGLTGCADGATRAWDVATGMPLGPVRWHQASVVVLAFSHAGELFATGSRDRTACVWHAPAAPLEGRLEAVKAWVELLAGMSLDARGVERELSPKEKDQRHDVLALPENAAFAVQMTGGQQGAAGK